MAAKGFQLTANLVLKAPGLMTMSNEIRNKLSSKPIDLKFKFDSKANERLEGLNKRLAITNTLLKKTAKDAQIAATAMKSLSKSISSITPSQQKFIKNLNDTTKQLTNVKKKADESKDAVRKFGEAGGLALRRFAAFSAATAIVFGFINAVKGALSEAIAFERQLLKVAQVSGQSIKSLGNLTDEITRLSVSLGVSSKELLDISVLFKQAGFSITETRIALEALAKSSLAPTFKDMNTTAEGSIAILRQFGLQTKELDAALGSINAVAGKFAVESNDIISAIKRAGAVFSAGSKETDKGAESLRQFIAVFTSIRATTRETAETIGTGMRTIITRIQRRSTIDFLKRFNIDLEDTKGNFIGVFDAVNVLGKALSTMGELSPTRRLIQEQLGGFRQIGKVIPMIEQTETRMKALKVATEGQASMNKDAADAQSVLAVQLTATKQNFLALIREFQDSVTFDLMAASVLSLADALIEITRAIKPLIPLMGAAFAFRAFGITKRVFGGAKAGITQAHDGGKIQKFARGGLVPGSGNSDTVPANLTPGEFVVRKKAVQSIGAENLQGFNEGGRVGYAGGGFAGGRFSLGARALSIRSSRKPSGKGFPRKDKTLRLNTAYSLFGAEGRSEIREIEDRKIKGGGIRKYLNDGMMSWDMYKYDVEALKNRMYNERNVEGAPDDWEDKIYEDIDKRFGTEPTAKLIEKAWRINRGKRLTKQGTGARFSSRRETLKSKYLDFTTKKGGPSGRRYPASGSGVLSSNLKFRKFSPVGVGFIRKAEDLGLSKKQIEYSFDQKKQSYAPPAHSMYKEDVGALRMAAARSKEAATGAPANMVEIDKRIDEMYGSRATANAIVEAQKANRGRRLTRPTALRKKLASGGGVSGAGVSSTDTVPALLTPGEFVLSKEAASKYTDKQLFDMNNADKRGVRGFAKGGRVKMAGGGYPPTYFKSSDSKLRDLQNALSAPRRTGMLAGEQTISSQEAASIASVGHSAQRDVSGFFKRGSRSPSGPTSSYDITGSAATSSLALATEKAYIDARKKGLTIEQAGNERVKTHNTLLNESNKTSRKRNSVLDATSKSLSRFGLGLKTAAGMGAAPLGGGMLAGVRKGVSGIRGRMGGSGGMIAAMGLGFAGSKLTEAGMARGDRGGALMAGGGGALSGAAAGAAVGAMFGPIGIALGGTVGALVGFTSGLNRANEAIKAKDIAISNERIESLFEAVGKMPESKRAQQTLAAGVHTQSTLAVQGLFGGLEERRRTQQQMRSTGAYAQRGFAAPVDTKISQAELAQLSTKDIQKFKQENEVTLEQNKRYVESLITTGNAAKITESQMVAFAIATEDEARLAGEARDKYVELGDARIDGLNKEAETQRKTAEAHQKAAEAIKKANTETKAMVSLFDDMTARMAAASQVIDQLAVGTANVRARIDDPIAMGTPETRNVFTNLRGFTQETVKEDLKALSSELPESSEGFKALTRTILETKDVQDRLGPAFERTKRNLDTMSGDEFANQLKVELGPVGDTILDTIDTVFGGITIDEALEGEQLSTVMNSISARGDAAAKAMAAFQDGINKSKIELAKQTQEVINLRSALVVETAVRKSRIESLKIEQGVLFERRSKTVEEKTRGFRTQLRGLGVDPGADISNIRIAGIVAKRARIQETLDTGQRADGTAIDREERLALSTEFSSLTEALKLLATNTEALRATQDKIKELQQKQLAEEQGIENIALMGPEQRRELIRQVASAQQFRATGEIGKLKAADVITGEKFLEDYFGASQEEREASQRRRNRAILEREGRAGISGTQREAQRDINKLNKNAEKQIKLQEDAAKVGEKERAEQIKGFDAAVMNQFDQSIRLLSESINGFPERIIIGGKVEHDVFIKGGTELSMQIAREIQGNIEAYVDEQIKNQTNLDGSPKERSPGKRG